MFKIKAAREFRRFRRLQRLAASRAKIRRRTVLQQKGVVHMNRYQDISVGASFYEGLKDGPREAFATLNAIVTMARVALRKWSR